MKSMRKTLRIEDDYFHDQKPGGPKKKQGE